MKARETDELVFGLACVAIFAAMGLVLLMVLR